MSIPEVVKNAGNIFREDALVETVKSFRAE